MHLVVLQRNHLKKNMQELWFLCITRRFNVLNKWERADLLALVCGV